jgi:DNA-3-methyladenine glycosylase II
MREVQLSEISFQLKPVPPFRLDLTAWVLRRRTDNLWDHWDGQVYRRVLVLRGKPVEVRVRQIGPPADPKLDITAAGPRLASGATSFLTANLNRILGLQIDLENFYRFAGKDRLLKGLAQRFQGMKPPRFPMVFEALVNAIACQQFTLTSGIRMLNRVVTAWGMPLSGTATSAHAFPRPEDMAGLETEILRNLGFSRQKAAALIDLARTVNEGRLDLESLESMDDEGALERLQELRGVGRWTAEYALLRGLGRFHIFPGDDVGVRNRLQRWLNLRKPLDYEGVRRILGRWQPYGGLIYFHLLLTGLEEGGYLNPLLSASRPR